MSKFYQQGDVLIVKVDRIPEGSPKEDKIVAEGEVTGHMHRVLGDANVVVDKDGNLFVDAPNGADVTHDEHNTVSVGPGQYKIRIVQEYDPLEDTIQEVRD